MSMGRRVKRPKIKMASPGNRRAGKDKPTPVRRAGLGGRVTPKSDVDPTHSLFRDDCPRALYSGTMDLCYVELSRRMPGYSTDYLLTMGGAGGWTIKPYEKPEVENRHGLSKTDTVCRKPTPKVEPEPASQPIPCPRCKSRGCADCNLDPIEPAGAIPACSGPSEGGSSTGGAAGGPE